MHVLFVHQNFPAQFRYIGPRLASEYGWRCTFATRNDKSPALPGVERVVYRARTGPTRTSHAYTRGFESAMGHCLGAYEALKARPDIRPDLVVAHSGFGSSLFLPHLYDAPVINFFEYFFRPVGQNLGYRPEFDFGEVEVLRSRIANAMVLLDLDNCDRGWCPNFAQRDVMPREYHPKLAVIPEGVDTGRYSRRQFDQRRLPDGREVDRSAKIVTYVSRGFELTRGFDVFMRAARRISAEVPDALFLVVGSDKPHYAVDQSLTGGRLLRECLLKSGGFDESRFCFTGWVDEDTLIDVLSLSDLHIYLTVPFITSWSFLDAMSCGCAVVASDQACVREYITDGENGHLCDFFDADGLADRALQILNDPVRRRDLGVAARRTILQKYSLDVALPQLKQLFETVAARKREPTMRVDALARAGVPLPWLKVPGAERQLEEDAALPTFDGIIPFPAPRSAASNFASTTPPPDATPEARHAPDRKTILFTWELGGGLGHVMQMLPLVNDLASAGHCVVVALRQLEHAVSVFGKAGVFYLQAPHSTPRPAGSSRATSFAQLLANVGFGDENNLFALACAWRNLIRTVAPDLIVFDHSPVALLAARAFTARRAVLGSGFCCPPGGRPNEVWAPLRPASLAADPAPARAAEADVLRRINWVLANWGEAPLGCLSQLYSDADETFLTTFPEFDHFRGHRELTQYWGPVLAPAGGGLGEPPQWPDGRGKRVFAYLKPYPEAEDVLAILKRKGCPALAYVDGLPAGWRRRLRAPTLRIVERPVDLGLAGRDCDVSILNAGHGATAEMLLSGKPVLSVPLVLEQQQTARAVERLGAGYTASPSEPYAILANLDSLLSDETNGHCAGGARRFAERYALFDRARQRRAMYDRVSALLAAGERGEDVPQRAEEAALL